jgi:hypothetical protein
MRGNLPASLFLYIGTVEYNGETVFFHPASDVAPGLFVFDQPRKVPKETGEKGETPGCYMEKHSGMLQA